MVKNNETAGVATVKPVEKKEPVAMKSADIGYTEKPLISTAKAPEVMADDPNKVMVKALCSFGGIEGDKGPTSKPFPVSRQRYLDLKANSLVELASEDDK